VRVGAAARVRAELRRWTVDAAIENVPEVLAAREGLKRAQADIPHA